MESVGIHIYPRPIYVTFQIMAMINAKCPNSGISFKKLQNTILQFLVQIQNHFRLLTDRFDLVPYYILSICITCPCPVLSCWKPPLRWLYGPSPDNAYAALPRDGAPLPPMSCAQAPPWARTQPKPNFHRTSRTYHYTTRTDKITM